MVAINGTTIAIRNPSYNALGSIDCEIDHPTYGWIPYTASPADSNAAGPQIYARALTMSPAAYTAPAPTQADYSNAIQAHLDTLARSKDYEDAKSLAGYADPPLDGDSALVAKFKAEGTAFKAYRNEVWAYAYTQLGLVESGARTPQPSVATIISELPVMVWPD